MSEDNNEIIEENEEFPSVMENYPWRLFSWKTILFIVIAAGIFLAIIPSATVAVLSHLFIVVAVLYNQNIIL